MSDEFDPDDLIDDVVVVLLAAGSGTRLGSKRPKAFVGLAGEPLLVHSLRAFERHEAVDSIVLVVPEDWTGPVEVLVDDVGCDKVTSIEVGGASRAASLRAGLAAVPDRRATAVLVHDAARPVVPEALVDRVLAPLADGWDCVVPGIAAVDTVKLCDEQGAVQRTLPRHLVRAVQTPQAVRASSLHAAIGALDEAQLAALTDDAQAIEQADGRVLVVEGDERAVKVTTAADLHALERVVAGVPAAAGAGAGEDEVDDDEEPDHPDDLEPLDEDDLAGFER